MTRRVAAAMPAFQVEALVAEVVRRTLAVLPDLLVVVVDRRGESRQLTSLAVAVWAC